MKSPFPGMDPYLERHWRDVHARLILHACNAIQEQLGGGLRARIEERLVVEEDCRETFVQIIDSATGGRVITMVEFLSATNKLPGDGRRKYLQKQREAMEADINLVEIDLIRPGEPVFCHSIDRLPEEWRTTYLAGVLRGHGHGTYEFYRMPLRQRLPVIRIPLRQGDPDIILDIQSLIDRAYSEGRYDDIDYSRPPDPPFSEADAAWAAEILDNRDPG